MFILLYTYNKVKEKPHGAVAGRAKEGSDNLLATESGVKMKEVVSTTVSLVYKNFYRGC